MRLRKGCISEERFSRLRLPVHEGDRSSRDLGVDQSDFFTGKTEKSARDGILIWCADRLQAVKWRNFKVHFYQQETMVSPPIKLAIPLLLNLYTNPREDQDKVITDSWVFGPVLKMVGEFEASVKKYPLIAMGTPDPYTPPH